MRLDDVYRPCANVACMSKNKQINIRVDDDFLRAMSQIRRSGPPAERIPSVGDVVRDLVLREAARLAQTTDRRRSA